MPLILIVLLVLILGGFGGWGFNTYHAGYGLPGGIGLIILLLVICWVAGWFRGPRGPVV